MAAFAGEAREDQASAARIVCKMEVFSENSTNYYIGEVCDASFRGRRPLEEEGAKVCVDLVMREGAGPVSKTGAWMGTVVTSNRTNCHLDRIKS